MINGTLAWEDIPAALHGQQLSVLLVRIRKFCEEPALRETNLRLSAMHRAATHIEGRMDGNPAPGSFRWFCMTLEMLRDAACLMNKVLFGPVVSSFSEKESTTLAEIRLFCRPENLRQAQEAVGNMKNRPGGRFVFGPAPAWQWYEETATFLVGAGCLAALMWEFMKPKKMV